MGSSLDAQAAFSGSGRAAVAGRVALERQIGKLDRQWLDAEQHAKAEWLDRMLTSRYVEVLPGGRVGTKSDSVHWLATMRRRSGSDFTLDDFKLRAFYGNIVLATDHMMPAGPDREGRQVTGGIVGTKVFVQERGRWKVAAAVLLPLGHFVPVAVSSPARVKRNGLARKYADIEKELRELDRKWEQAIRDRDLTFMQKLYAPQCFIVLASGRWINRKEILDINANPHHDSKVKPFPYDFELLAVYGDFAIATDRTVFKEGNVPNGPTPGEYRTLKFFVKQNGTWSSAGASDVPIPPA